VQNDSVSDASRLLDLGGLAVDRGRVTPVLLYLAAAGVGRLGIIDDDPVDMSNLQRQVIHGAADVGASRSTARSTASTGFTPASTSWCILCA